MRKFYILKAGCIVYNKETNKFGLIYRKKHNDYEFPKGHLEINETLTECAIRETAEEIKRNVTILNKQPVIIKYKNKKSERCKVFYYVAKDEGSSDNESPDYHKLIWTDYKDVERMLTHNSVKLAWKKSKKLLNKLFQENQNFKEINND